VPWNLKENKIGEIRQEGVFSLKYNEKLAASRSSGIVLLNPST
jgi:hypothetical protein